MKYDLHEPGKWDRQLEGTVDIAVVDVPYLNEVRCFYPGKSWRNLKTCKRVES